MTDGICEAYRLEPKWLHVVVSIKPSDPRYRELIEILEKMRLFYEVIE